MSDHWSFTPYQTLTNSFFVGLFCWIFITMNATSAYFADWSAIGGIGRDHQPVCVSIPANMTLCRNIGYTKMRLPNLLEHDTMQEVSQQAASWVPLLNINCHDDSQLFLCALFAPVCLERPIYPCRSLCQKVKAGCLGTMESHGFPWPPMLDCDKFPLDNDMCITSQSGKRKHKNISENSAKDKAGIVSSAEDVKENPNDHRCRAKPCNQAGTYENILANYCQADFVVKMKFRQVRKRSLWGRKVNTVYKTWRGTPSELRKLRKPKLRLESSDNCCSDWIDGQTKRQRYLVMGKKVSVAKGDVRLIPSFIHPWTRSKEMKRARRMFKQIDCKNIRETSQRVIAERAYASTRDLHALFAGNLRSKSSLPQSRATERRSRRNKSISFGVNRKEPVGTRFSMSPMEELISVTRSKSKNNAFQNNRHSKRRMHDIGKKQNWHRRRNKQQNNQKYQKVASNHQKNRSYQGMSEPLLVSRDKILGADTRTTEDKTQLDRS